jgi:D-alanine-D-alanine ligase
MIHIGVFFGGTSVEHEVSIITAQQAIAQLRSMTDYKVVPIYISKDNRWYTGDYLLEVEHFKDLKKVVEHSTRVSLVKGNRNAFMISDPVKRFSDPLVGRLTSLFPSSMVLVAKMAVYKGS